MPATRFVWSAAAAALPQLTTFVLTPALIDRLGRNGFGLWVLIQTTAVVAAASDLGIAGSVTRFLAVHRGAEDRAATTRLLVTVSGVLLVASGIVDLAVLATGSHLIGMLGLGAELRQAARSAIAPLCVLLPAVMAAGLAAATAVAYDRFRLTAVVLAGSCTMYAGSVLVTVHGVSDLPRLVWLGSGQALVTTVALAVALARRLDREAIGLMHRRERAALRRYAWRVQLANLSALVNTELDAVIIAALLPVRSVGVYGIAAAASAAVRSLPLYAVPPLRNALSFEFGRHGREAALAEFARMHRQWLALVIPYSAVTVVCTPFCVMAWLGRDYRFAGLAGTLLVIGFAVNLTTAITSAAVQAVGRADLESRYGIAAVVINLVLTLPLGLAFGLYGVAAATAVATASSSLYFFRLVMRSGGFARTSLLPGATTWRCLPVASVALGAQVLLERAGLSPGLPWLVPALALSGLAVATSILLDPVARDAARRVLRPRRPPAAGARYAEQVVNDSEQLPVLS